MRWYVIIIVLLLPVAGLSAPTISSAPSIASDGGSINITGTDFGTKANAAPLIWDNFEDYSDGSSLTSQGVWTLQGTPPSTPAITNTDAVSGSMSAMWTFTDACDDDCFGLIYRDIGEQDELYASVWWQRAEEDCGSIQKHFRFNNDTVYSGTPAIKVSGYDTSATAPNRPLFTYNTGDSGDLGDHHAGNQAWDTWHRIEAYSLLSTPGSSDGTIDFSVNGTHPSGLPDSSIMNRASGISDEYNIFMLGGGLTYPTKTCYELVDSVYLDTDQARVEICTGSTWASRGTCDIQPWSAWSATSITVTVNQGPIADGTAYLFVIDDNGDASSGYAITLSSSTPTFSGIGGSSGLNIE